MNNCSTLCHPDEPCSLTEDGKCQEASSGNSELLLRPIESSPRDGTMIILWDELMGYSIGKWSEYVDEFSEDEEGEKIKRVGWNDGFLPIVADSKEPTHWHPLPVLGAQ